MKKVLLVDIDNTILKTTEAWLNVLNNRYGTNVSQEDLLSWDMKTYFSNLSIEEICQPLTEKDFWKIVSPYYDAIEYLAKLNETQKYDIYLCSASHYATVSNKITDAVLPYFSFLNLDKNVIVCQDKHLLKADYLIDDGAHNFGPDTSYKGIILTQPYNKDFDDAHNNIVARCGSWKEIYEILK